ncbi:hypothetical protein K458DRAFT_393006 [Lentithecium fluviatile CBS 122367]|uniref:Uncharacterized protein n=1 Tax=Lentithecium fluviatile CBS 122367 TaxID=1168545 RepID=A0A6G1IR63_9PLEO|nr:hypothetical protein K458DRAFT_393006 [Lentithecium fluviatile CBS 122367]
MEAAARTSRMGDVYVAGFETRPKCHKERAASAPASGTLGLLHMCRRQRKLAPHLRSPELHHLSDSARSFAVEQQRGSGSLFLTFLQRPSGGQRSETLTSHLHLPSGATPHALSQTYSQFTPPRSASPVRACRAARVHLPARCPPAARCPRRDSRLPATSLDRLRATSDRPHAPRNSHHQLTPPSCHLAAVWHRANRGNSRSAFRPAGTTHPTVQHRAPQRLLILPAAPDRADEPVSVAAPRRPALSLRHSTLQRIFSLAARTSAVVV